MSQSTSTEMAGVSQPGLMPLIIGYMGSRAVHVAAELGIADLLAQGPKTSEALANETGTHAPSLHRLLRALAGLGVLDEIEPGRFTLTELGAQLRTGVPGSMRNLAMMFGSERAWRSWHELRRSIRTGEPVMRHVFGVDNFDYLSAHPQEAAVFNEAMAEFTRQVARSLVEAYDFTRFHAIVDVGGGNGTLITAVLDAASKLRGIVFDLPSGAAQARDRLEAAGLAERCDVIAGDFFRSVPAGADAYILKSIIHYWDDQRSLTILKNCREAISADGKFLLVERVMPERMETSASHQRWTMIDMHMMVMLGGCERTQAEYERLLAAAGFKWMRALLLPGATGFSLIEAIPADVRTTSRSGRAATRPPAICGFTASGGRDASREK